MLEHVIEKIEGRYKTYDAEEGYVITNYNEGDDRFYPTKSLVMLAEREPEGFYTLTTEEANALDERVNEPFRKLEEERLRMEEEDRRRMEMEMSEAEEESEVEDSLTKEENLEILNNEGKN